MLFLFLLYLVQNINALVVREIVHGTCPGGWKSVTSLEQCSELQFTLNHFYRYEPPSSRWTLAKIEQYIEQQENINIETVEVQDASRPSGCFGDGYMTSFFNSLVDSDAECDDDTPCLCVQECPDNTVQTLNGVHFYDDTRRQQVDGNNEIFYTSTFSKRHFNVDDLTHIWPPAYWDKIHSTPPLCTPCPPGTGESNGKCQICPAGKFSTSLGQGHTCQDCAVGKYTSVDGALECETCPVNHQLSGDQTSCTSCKELKKADHDSVATTPCEDCPTDQHSTDGGPCQDCPTGKSGQNCKDYRCDVMQEYDGSACSDLTLDTETETRTKFDQLIKDLPYGEEAVNQKRIVQQFANIVGCSSTQSFRKRLVKRDQNGNIAFLPGLLVTPWSGTNEQNCKTPTRQWEKGKCVIDYETELLDYLHYQHYMIGFDFNDSGVTAKCKGVITDCDDATRITNCQCGDEICYASTGKVCHANECIPQPNLFFTNGPCSDSDYQQISAADCVKYAERLNMNLLIPCVSTSSCHVVTLDDFIKEMVDYYTGKPFVSCFSKGANLILTSAGHKDSQTWRGRINGENRYWRFKDIEERDRVIKTDQINFCRHRDCKRNEQDTNCWCDHSDWCINQYCLYGHCADNPICENENGQQRLAQTCTCGYETCDAGQLCVNGECLDELFCPDTVGTVAAPYTCSCGSDKCSPGEYCVSGACGTVPVCPNTNGLEMVQEECACGSKTCAVEQFCFNGECRDYPQCLGYENKTVPEPTQCRCTPALEHTSSPIVCEKDQICYENACYTSEQADEKKGRTFFNGECKKNGVIIPDITSRKDCLRDTDMLHCKTDGIHSYNKPCSCGDGVCQAGQYCYFNKCVDNPVCPYQTTFLNYCTNGQLTLTAVGSGNSCEEPRWGVCSLPSLLTKNSCEQDAKWGYCSNSSILSEFQCVNMTETWHDKCTNLGINLRTDCYTHTWSYGCYVGQTRLAGIHTQEHCLQLTSEFESKCECNPLGSSVTCDKGEKCVGGKCKSQTCAVNDLEPLTFPCECKSTDLCHEGRYCHRHGCEDRPMCGFHTGNDAPAANLNCICERLPDDERRTINGTLIENIVCDNNDILRPCDYKICLNSLWLWREEISTYER